METSENKTENQRKKMTSSVSNHSDNKSKRKQNIVASTFKGTFLANEKVRNYFPFILVLVILAMFYIYNNYMAEKYQRAIKKIEPIHEAYLTNYRNAEAQFTDSSKLSNISKTLSSIGLKEARVSPKVIKVKEFAED